MSVGPPQWNPGSMSAKTVAKKPPGPASKNQRIALGIGAALLLAGAIGPWVTVFGVIQIGPTVKAEVSIIVFGGVLLLALCAALGKYARGCSIGVGSLALLEAGVATVKLHKAQADPTWGELIEPGWGLYLTVIVGVALIASTFVVKREVRLEPAVAG